MNTIYMGAMTGTSMDAIDVGVFRLDSACQLLACFSAPMPDTIRQSIRTIQTQDISLELVAQIDQEIGILYAQAILDTLKQNQSIEKNSIRAIGMAGQTLMHEPLGTTPFTWQAGDANQVAKRTGITTVTDFRRGDMALGGQGAPLASCFHHFAFASKLKTVVVNIGGIANISLVEENGSSVSSFDCGPGMCLMDRWIQKHQQKPYDIQGQWAEQFDSVDSLLDDFIKHPFMYKSAPKSACVRDFSLEWLESCLDRHAHLSAGQIQASLLAWTSHGIAKSIPYEWQNNNTRLILCGGGARNTALVHSIGHATGMEPTLSDDYGLSVEWVETAAFAWLAQQRLLKQTASRPSTTGIKKPTVLGAVYI